jgi:exopolysaccharide biosynthesis predicted pyruvyltransferase EpsI
MQKNKKQKTKAKKKEKVEWSGHPFWPNVGDPLWSDWVAEPPHEKWDG